MIKRFIMLAAAVILTGCSVIMSASKPTRPVSEERVIELTTREQVEKKLSGNIVSEVETPSGTLVTYSHWYDRSARVRMVAHTGLDVVTLGLWELVGTMGEANTNPTAYYDIEVLYGDDDEIKRVEVRQKL